MNLVEQTNEPVLLVTRNWELRLEAISMFVLGYLLNEWYLMCFKSNQISTEWKKTVVTSFVNS